MGCASSTPADQEPASKKNDVANSATSENVVTAKAQPLYNGPAITNGTPEPQVAVAAPAPQVPNPGPAAATAGAPVAQASPRAVQAVHAVQVNGHEASPRKEVKRERSSLSHRAAAREDDEDSDWDQCSTSNFNVTEEAQTPKECEPRALGSSVMEKAASTSLYAGASANYKETTTLRIDKVKGCMFVNQYLVVKFLGRGACGKVFLCLNTHDLRLYAMKAVRKVDLENSQSQQAGAKRRNPMEDLKREIMIMKKMKHVNIVTLTEVIDDPAGSKLLLVMEFMEGGPVLTREALEKRERLPESLALQYFRDMIKALDYLHCFKVVHGDLKPENVLMAASGDVKLSDFGCSKVFATGNEYLERCNGTPAFLAPEMMKPNTRYRGRPTDVYALGACLYTLVFGRIPFSAPNLYKLFQVVQNEPVKYPEDVPITDSLKDVLGCMLHKNPRERISLMELMKHPWVTMDGKFPLKSSRELRSGESQEQHDGVKVGCSFAEYNPRPDFLQGLAQLSRHERTFQEGEVIMRQNDAGTYLMYIVSGTVDVLHKWQVPPKRTPSQLQPQPGSAQAMAAAGQRPQPGQGGRGAGGDEFMDESDSMSPITDDESRQHRINLLQAAVKARDFIKSLQHAAARPTSPVSRDVLIAQRGPGELVGDMALFSKSLTRCATVRCASRVTARIITHEQLVEYLMQQPLAKHQIREGIWKKESEITMVEALVKLANAQEVIAASLEHQPGPSSGPVAALAPHHHAALVAQQQQQQQQLAAMHYMQQQQLLQQQQQHIQQLRQQQA